MSSHVCLECGTETTYQAFSGGREWYCPGCGADGTYPDHMEDPPRAVLLQTPEGRIALRAQMDQELARLRDEQRGEA